MKVKVYSAALVTKDNLNGKGVIDLDTPEGVAIFGGEGSANEYKRERKIQEQITKTARATAIKELDRLGV